MVPIAVRPPSPCPSPPMDVDPCPHSAEKATSTSGQRRQIRPGHLRRRRRGRSLRRRVGRLPSIPARRIQRLAPRISYGRGAAQGALMAMIPLTGGTLVARGIHGALVNAQGNMGLRAQLGQSTFALVYVTDAVVGAAIAMAPSASASVLSKAASSQHAAGSGRNPGAASAEIIERWMSRAEMNTTQETGLMRAGRPGIHFATGAANTSAFRARQRLALPQTPEVRVTMEVQGGKFGPATPVEPRFNMLGGGLERQATGKVSVEIVHVDGGP